MPVVETPQPQITQDKQLLHLDVAATLFKWRNDIACNPKEVALATGYSYSKIRNWDLPWFEGGLTRTAFLKWKRQKERAREELDRNNEIKSHTIEQGAQHEDRRPGPATAARQRRLNAGKFCGSPSKRDSRAA